MSIHRPDPCRQESDCAPGFKKLQHLHDRFFSFSFLVPLSLHEALQEEAAIAAIAAAQELTREKAKNERSAQIDDEPPAWGVKSNAVLEAVDRTCAEAMFWAELDRAPTSRGQYRVFTVEQATAMFGRLQLLHREERKCPEALYEKIKDKGLLRDVVKPRLADLESLAVSQPHMAEVVDFVRGQIHLAARARRPPRIPPILLVGEPGIGKTHFAQGLAKALRAPLSIQRLDADLTGALFLGSDKKWSTSTYGVLFDLLVLGTSANPVIVLDEIDKINRSEHRVQASLFSLLEPVSAKCLRDISLDFEMDASLVTWIATANDATRLEEPLRSRFKEFHIKVPTAAQCLVLAREVIRSTVRDIGVRGISAEAGIERHLAHLPARQIQQAIREAIARVAQSGRAVIGPRDLPAALLGDDGAESSHNYLH